ncbi:MAG: MFS transporter, partial [Nocardioidaceae bacterium]|nr:MFS transporter [Nocardioidaceae bacterium]
TQPPVDETRRDRGADPPLGWALLLPLVFAAVCLGSLFGATEVVTVAFAEEQGSPGATGPLLAGWAAGSLIAGLITGAVNLKSSASKRYRLGAVGMGCAMVPLPFVDGLAVLAVALFVAGFAISPTMVASVSLVESNVPASRLTEGITWLLTGLGLGIAPGAAIAGRLIDEFGASPAYYVPVVSGVLAAVIAVLTPARTSEHTPALSPN